ncbi:rabphilin-3A-like [Mesocricetus auratus]|uniref:Rabphilin-3A-like n=1 Tax=Mesocricetus auratus TaxID=10036 RepID=A0ABM2Y9N9_MESAU|nr:rabphilin-3A-like [Mesocricetus auratus]
MGPAARGGTPGTRQLPLPLRKRTRQAEGSGGAGQALPEVKRPLRAPARRASRPRKVSAGSAPPPQSAGPGSASVRNGAELRAQASPSPAERARNASGSVSSLSAARPRPGNPPPSRHALLRSRPRPSKKPAAAFTSALWSAARSRRLKRIPTRHSCPAGASSHPRPLRCLEMFVYATAQSHPLVLPDCPC